MPLETVSIVLPTYNGSKYLKHAIESCLNQTYKNIQLIIVNDGSTENIRALVHEFDDRRLCYLKHYKNLGIPAALNTGFAKAEGEFLTWTSDDNIYSPDAIEKMLRYMQKHEIYFVYCDYFMIANDDIPNRKLIKLPDLPAMAQRCDIGPCFLYSKTVKDVIGDYNTTFPLVADYDYWIRTSLSFDMGHIKEPLYFYRVHEKALSVTRYYDMSIDSVLIRLNHGLLDPDLAADSIIKSFACLYPGYKKLDVIAINAFSSGKQKALMNILHRLISLAYKFYTIIHGLFLRISILPEIRLILENYKKYPSKLWSTRYFLRKNLGVVEYDKKHDL